MAERQTREGYVADLSREHFTNFARMIHRLSPEQGSGLAIALKTQLDRLGVPRNAARSVVYNFEGSMNIDTGSLIDWAKRIQSNHRRAIRQLVQLDATAYARSGAV